MAKVKAPNTEYNGVSASVQFNNGVGDCTDPYLLNWFKSKGYEVEEIEKNDASELENMDVEELKKYAEINGIDIGQSSSQKGILKKILESKQE